MPILTINISAKKIFEIEHEEDYEGIHIRGNTIVCDTNKWSVMMTGRVLHIMPKKR
jgi:hypothetical protein